MRRVAVLGPGGAGKTAISLELGCRLGLPVVHLDRIYWRPGWSEPSREEWEAAHRDALSAEAWIADGNYGSTMAERLSLADTIVLVDRHPALCVWRLLRRKVCWFRRVRDDLPPGCVEHLRLRETLAFCRYVWRYRRDRLPGVLARIHAAGPGKRVEILRSEEDVRRFLDAARL